MLNYIINVFSIDRDPIVLEDAMEILRTLLEGERLRLRQHDS